MRERKGLIISLIVMIMLLGTTFGVLGLRKNKDYVDKLIEKYKPVGVTVAIIENGKIEDLRNYGYANKEEKTLVGNETQFKIASISKTVTSYAVMKLVDEGKLDLDVPVNTYLKKWKLPKSDFDENKVTLRTLMSHTSGITGSDENGYKYPLPTIDQALKDRDIKIKREPGTVFEYSEFAGLAICQLVIEDVTGEKFEDYMENHIFKNLNMNNTNYANESSNGSFAVPYAGFNKPINITPIVMNGGGGVSTTANDLATFAIELMNYYNNGNKEMFKAQKNTESIAGKYALGIIPRELKNGKTVYEHNGTLTGWNAQMVIEPISKNGIVILTNSDKAFYLTYELMEKWGEKVVGEKIIDTQINQVCVILYKVIGLIAALLILLIAMFIIKLKKGKIVLVERERRNRRYSVWVFVFLILAAGYYILIYTGIPFKVLFGMNNYLLFTFFPPSYIWVNILLVIFTLFLIFRSGYTKKKNNAKGNYTTK